MANYYYARVRNYVSTNDSGLSSADYTNNLVKANPIPVSDASADGKSKKQYVWYVVDVYKTTNPSFAAWSTLPVAQMGTLLTGDSRRVTFNLPSKDTHYTTSSDVSYYVAAGSIISVNSHLQWTLSNNLGVPRSITPSISVYQSDATGSDVAVTNILWVNTANKAPTIKITGAGGAPTYPTDAVNTWLKTQYGAAYAKANITISSTTWSICNKQWCYMVVDNKDGSVTLWYSDENATKFTMALGKKPAITDQPKRQAWNSQNAAAYTKAIDATACKDVVNPPTTGNGFNVNVEPPTETSRWNPPPHSQSRSVPYSIRSGFYDNSTLNPETVGFNALQNSANFYSLTGSNVIPSKGYSYLERGRIFQDSNSADVLNGVNTNGKPSKSGSAKQWGFRFMYNPSSFSYSTQANNSIDWTLGSKDTAALLAGNQTVTFQLYINRVVDLSYLNLLYGYKNSAAAANQMSIQAAYGRELTDDEKTGILNRGTEYDLEFLYRCLTGDPITNNPLLNDSLRKTGSADIGYITGIPLWLYLSDNIRYFGSISGFEVNHLIFNTEMVPTLSVVSISFSRYPAQFGNDSTSLKSVHDSFFPPANK
jgi:hypothetical protein